MKFHSISATCTFGLAFFLTLACLPTAGVDSSDAGSPMPGSGGASSASSGGTSGVSSGGNGPSSGGTTGTGSGGRAASSGGATATGGSAAGTGGTGPRTGGATGTGGVTAGTGGTPAPAGTLTGDVAFSTPSQSFKGQLQVGMTTTIAGAMIRYTTDGTLPTASSTMYSAPIMLTVSTQVRAQPFVNGAAGGLVSTAVYILRTIDPSSKLPILLLDGYSKGISTDKTTYKDAAVMIFEPVNGTAVLTSLPTIATRAAYHLRGQSSAGFPQKPYKIEFRDNADGDSKYPVLGMAADSDWALIAPYYDRALIRNPFTYTLGQEMGISAPNSHFVEVYLTGAAGGITDATYQGIYWLTETIKISGHRTDLKKLTETDTTTPNVTGGYIFKFDQAATDAMAPHLTCTASTGVTCWKDCEVTDPIIDTPTPPHLPAAAQLTWLNQYVQSFHNTLFTTPIGNYAQYISVPSFVDYLIIGELTRNVDAYVRSAFFSKDRDGLLMGGPLWDYNFALGVGGQNSINPASSANDGGWQFQGLTAGSLPGRNVSSWFPKLMSDPAFVTQVKARWKSLRTGLLSQASIEARINMLTAQLDAAAVARDFAKWPVSVVYPATGGGGGIRIYGPTVATWDGQVQAMHDYLIARAAWMDTQWQ